MKINSKFILVFSFICLIFSSACEKEETLNNEADILALTFNPASILASKPNISDKNITVLVVKGTDITKLTPIFRLTKGATIEPSGNKEMDFSNPVEFTVTSEDKATKNTYKIIVSFPFESTAYSFENWKANLRHPYNEPLKGEQPVEKDNDKTIDYWASSNFGYGFLNDEDEKDAYPVKETVGVKGKGVSIVTKKGMFIFGIGAPIIAGSLFSGSFDEKAMMATPMKSTHFGQPIDIEPKEIKGYYSYKSGKKVTDKDGKEISGRKDEGIISAVFYEIDDNFSHLDGDNLYTDDHIISMGRFVFSDTEGEGYHEFSLKLEPINGTKELDLKNKKYKLALVFSSSEKGGEYIGAIGSELKIDEIEVLTK